MKLSVNKILYHWYSKVNENCKYWYFQFSLALLLLISGVFSAGATNLVGCPDSTYCTDSIIVLCYDSNAYLDTVDQVQFKVIGTGTWFIESVDSVVGGCLFISNPSLDCDTDIFSNLKFDDKNGTRIGSCSGQNIPLPVELIRFTAERIGTAVLIEWATASEFNNSHFLLERSTDYTEWKIINVIPSANPFSNQVLTYSYLDREAHKDVTYYYSLTQVDFDNTTTNYGLTVVNGSEFEYPVEQSLVYDIIGKELSTATDYRIIRRNGKVKIIVKH